MTPLLTIAQFEPRVERNSLPLDDTGQLDAPRITAALEGATGIIVTHLPWLLDPQTGEVALPIDPQFAESLFAVCADIAFYRLTDRVSSDEDSRERYKSSLALLAKIDKEHQGGLSGPDLQQAEIVEPDEAAGIPDVRFFKKGELI